MTGIFESIGPAAAAARQVAVEPVTTLALLALPVILALATRTALAIVGASLLAGVAALLTIGEFAGGLVLWLWLGAMLAALSGIQGWWTRRKLRRLEREIDELRAEISQLAAAEERALSQRLRRPEAGDAAAQKEHAETGTVRSVAGGSRDG